VEWRGRLGLGTAGPSLNILNLINWILINFLRAENDKGSSIKKEIKKKMTKVVGAQNIVTDGTFFLC
jgi:hypothetical protein